MTITAEKDHRGLVRLTNATDRACLATGWAVISLVNAADEVVDVPTEKVGTPTSITLAPGAGAWTDIAWTTCDKGEPTCAAGNTLRVNLGDGDDGLAAVLEGFPNPERSDLTMASLRIGNLR